MASFPRFLSLFLQLCIISFSIVQVSLASNRIIGPEASSNKPFGLFPADTPPGINTCPVPQEQCSSECDRRCSATSHRNNCLMFCNMCCNKCLCVPPGTFGNKECCSCYDNWKTKEGGPKCP